ncbi:hypothetical protein L596_000565 [Steinernema carpocapsae]|uniref:Uncharacterized protein n=1 Tax=Steinernema carpocapsae TaxID=34508 RepID=A0A4U8UIU7_STECR|nr:hypothetical protein L596_000565 [Steinernema carpocapsae]
MTIEDKIETHRNGLRTNRLKWALLKRHGHIGQCACTIAQTVEVRKSATSARKQDTTQRSVGTTARLPPVTPKRHCEWCFWRRRLASEPRSSSKDRFSELWNQGPEFLKRDKESWPDDVIFPTKKIFVNKEADWCLETITAMTNTEPTERLKVERIGRDCHQNDESQRFACFIFIEDREKPARAPSKMDAIELKGKKKRYLPLIDAKEMNEAERTLIIWSQRRFALSEKESKDLQIKPNKGFWSVKTSKQESGFNLP